jgi:uncharacterized protein (DUF849 family)
MRGRYDPIFVTAAITGGDVLPSQSASIPRGVDQIVEQAVGAAEAGAACVHLHAREPDGRPTGSGELFAEIARRIRERCEVVINISTGGSPAMSEEERLHGVLAARPEVATFNLGTMNYEGFPNPARWPQVQTDWEHAVLQEYGQTIFRNTLGMMRRFAAAFREQGVTPELEAYDLGHIAMARFLLDEGTIEPPVRLQLVLGVLGGAGNSLDDLFLLKQAAERILGPDLGVLGVAATGFPMEFRHCAVALSWGLDCRVGLEDNLRITRGAQARSNAELVERVVQLAALLERPLGSAQQLRETLGAWAAGRREQR